jgi:hypothetical protein
MHVYGVHMHVYGVQMHVYGAQKQEHGAACTSIHHGCMRAQEVCRVMCVACTMPAQHVCTGYFFVWDTAIWQCSSVCLCLCELRTGRKEMAIWPPESRPKRHLLRRSE